MEDRIPFGFHTDDEEQYNEDNTHDGKQDEDSQCNAKSCPRYSVCDRGSSRENNR